MLFRHYDPSPDDHMHSLPGQWRINAATAGKLKLVLTRKRGENWKFAPASILIEW